MSNSFWVLFWLSIENHFQANFADRAPNSQSGSRRQCPALSRCSRRRDRQDRQSLWQLTGEDKGAKMKGKFPLSKNVRKKAPTLSQHYKLVSHQFHKGTFEPIFLLSLPLCSYAIYDPSVRIGGYQTREKVKNGVEKYKYLWTFLNILRKKWIVTVRNRKYKVFQAWGKSETSVLGHFI